MSEKDFDAMPRIVLLLRVHICGGGHHLSLLMVGLKVTEKGHVWVPAMFQMI
jgi:hypothetical protein